MARGWESKSVEDQINEREAAAKTKGKKKLSPAETERRLKQEGLVLARARAVAALDTTQSERYRTLLERTIAHLDSQLAELGF
jgi:hypothetical protein